jgi:antitoxin (DNA-binding transcriptional repressor) of toxin-antitoxin stability system
MSRSIIAYREFLKTPGRVLSRLSDGEALTLVADGSSKALIIPIQEGDVDTALSAWQRGRALLALARLQTGARRSGAGALGLGEINAEVRAVRRARRARRTQG